MGVEHVRHQPMCLLPRYKMIYPLRRGDMLGFVAPKELVQCKLTILPHLDNPKGFQPL